MDANATAVLFAHPDALCAEGAALPAVLDDADRAHIARFRFDRDRRLAAASRAVQRMAVAAAAGDADVAPALRFVRGDNGKPRIDVPAALRCWQFNTSNAHGLVGCAVATHPLGLDIEPLARTLAPELVAHCCSDGERAALGALADDRARAAAFFALWTRKEAWMKATGMGLSIEPARVGFAARGASTFGAATFDVLLDGDAQAAGAWVVRDLPAGDAHAAALCVREAHATAPVGITWVSVGAARM